MKRAFLVMVVGLSACGGGGSAPIPIDQLGPRVEQVLCNLEVRCGAFPDATTCSSSLTDSTAQLVADVKSGKTIYDGAKAAACLDAFNSVGCTQSTAKESPAACDETFTGTVAADGACFTGEECVSGFCDRVNCDVSVACCAGTCGPARVVIPEGGNCAQTDGNCAPGTFCDFVVAGTSTCKRRVAAGAACTSSFECATGLACVTPVGQTTGACGAFPKTGEDCSTTDLRCDANLDYCDPVTKKCTPRLAPGGACNVNTGVGQCLPYATCDAATGKCVGRSAVGGACTTGSDCFSSLCTAGACAERPAQAVCP